MKNRKIIVELKDAFKTFTFDQDKVLPPEDTVARFKEKLKEVNLDILKRTVRIDNGRLNIPVYFSICGKDAYQIIGTKKQMGKGGTPRTRWRVCGAGQADTVPQGARMLAKLREAHCTLISGGFRHMVHRP